MANFASNLDNLDSIMVDPAGKITIQSATPEQLIGCDQDELLRRHTETQLRINKQDAATPEANLALAATVREERELRKSSAESAAEQMQAIVAKREQASQERFEIELKRVLATETTATDKQGRRTVTLTHNASTVTQLTTLHPGSGPSCKPNSTVKCHYTGILPATGVTFDCSRHKQKEFTATLGCKALIQGWEWALSKMTLGERIELTIASDFAYGAAGVNNHIPPHSTLQFDLQLLQIDDIRCVDKISLELNAALVKAIQDEDLSQWVDDISLEQGSGNSKKKSKGGKGSKGGKKKKKKKR